DGQDQMVAEGQTDAQGLWSFPAPAPGHYLLIVDTGMGHRAREPIAVPDPGASSARVETISSGTRSDLTGFPYLKVGVGLASIALFSVAFLAARRKAHRPGP